jgi:hypothetical protein
MSTATGQKKKKEQFLTEKGTLGTQTDTLVYDKSTGILRGRRCGPPTLSEILTRSV